jgi:hypothetical protein
MTLLCTETGQQNQWSEDWMNKALIYGMLGASLLTNVVGALYFASDSATDQEQLASLSQMQATLAALDGQNVYSDSSRTLLGIHATLDGTTDLSHRYWTTRSLANAELRLTRARINVANQILLLDIFGSAVYSDPTFENVFRPYREKLGFLSAHQQTAIQKIEIDVLENELKAGASLAVEAGLPTVQLKDIRHLLSDDEVFEFELRLSFESQQLIASGFDFTEREFRDVFKILRTNSVEVRHLATLLQQQNETATALRAVFSPYRLQALIRIQDPDFRALQAATRGQSFSSEKIVAAYDVLVRARGELERLRASRLSNQTVAAFDSIAAARDRDLALILGPTLSAQLSRSRSGLMRLPTQALALQGSAR